MVMSINSVIGQESGFINEGQLQIGKDISVMLQTFPSLEI